ncbi:class I SAM-dependent methyltransferase [Gloeocapsopsis dulcis]|uniref:Tetracenomycin C synthesis protein n=1 Tax=Gloeocapsopsis dulcis AAB1 = 1H9 TaxID=1433147 RepID=A0A6N8FUQ9_9CHRO|nr:class I SAM-dependent methyltransferase [Gloeocapsopsis dulcis]MUL36870.1 tetracenomycin C synthesis protein [Gloeocapsopsis dulcis AAB1 = 1H9]WNN88520.1 class I SAM-dependent methyltransferase [Gloeocapsopsis dulcis]
MTTTAKEATDKISGVSETLMITLYARYVESQRQDAILRDNKATEIVEKIDYDFSKYAQGWASQLGCVIRAEVYDRLVLQFIQNHPKATIINLGAGLCTRFFRVDNGEITWYEVDFPEVIDLKRKLIDEGNRYRFIASSILETTWIEEIQRVAPVLIMMEGVSMYLTEVEMKTLFQSIVRHLAPVIILMDVIATKRAKNTKKHDTVSKTTAEFKWGLDNSKKLESWGQGIKVTDEIYYLTRFANYPDRLPWWGRYLRFILSAMFKNFGRVIQVEISK